MSKTLETSIEISGVLSPSLQAAIKNAVTNLEDMYEETLDAAGAAEKLAAEISAQEGVLKSLEKGYADFVVSGEESTEEAQKLAQHIQDLSGELDENRGSLAKAQQAAERLASGMDDAEGAAKQLGAAVEDAGDRAKNSSEGYTVLKNVIANLVTEGIGKAVDAFKEMATEGDKALGLLEARTGATTTQMEGFEDVMYEVYNANYGENLGAVSETLSTVIQMTDDLDNASLAQVTKNAIALEDVFGFGTTESLRAVNSLMDQFGITSDQAYNLIVQGAQNGLNQNDDLLDTINEYSVQFKDAGYSADDMFNMLVNGTETGTWSVDKLGDAMKEFNIRMSDGTANDYLKELGVDVDSVMKQFDKGGADAQKAIGTVMDAVLECDDATLQYQTGVGLFGTMWEDLGADTVASLMSVERSIDSGSSAMEQLNDAAYDTLEGAFGKLGRTIKAEVVQPIADKLTPVLKDAVNFVTTKVGPAVDWVLDNLPAIGIALGAVGATIAAMKWGSIVAGIGKLKGSFSALFGALKAIPGPVLAVIGVVTALAAGFAYLWKNNEDFRDNMTAVWEQLKGSFSELGGTIKSMIEQLAPIFSSLATTVLTAFGQIAEALLPVLVDLISSILPVVIDLVGQLIPVVSQIITAVLPVVVDLLNQLLPVVVQIISTVLPVVVDLLNQLLPIVMMVIDAAMQIITAILPVVVDLINQLLPVVTQIISTVLPLVVDLLNQLLPLAMQIISAVLPVVVDLLNQLLPFVMQVVEMVLPVLIDLINLLLPVVMEIIEAVLPVLVDLISSLLPIVTQIIEAVLPVLVEILNLLTPILNMVISLLQPILNLIIALVMPILNLIMSAITPLINIFMSLITSILQPIMPIIQSLANIFTAVLGSAIQAVQPIIQGIKNTFQGLINFITGVFSGNWSDAWDGIVQTFSGIWQTLSGYVKAPINAVIGLVNKAIDSLNGISCEIPDWVPGVGGQTFGINIPKIPLLASGGFTDGVSIAGEEAMEAVISFDPAYRDKNIGIWEKAGQLLGVLGSDNQSESLTSKAGQLLTLDDFSLGSLADGGGVVIYYDFSNFTWNPHIQAGDGEDEDDFMARLRAHEAEFFDWLEEFIKMREVAQYA